MSKNTENVGILYFDMDGVLADFGKKFYDISGGKHKDSVSSKILWNTINEYGKVKFFHELPWMSGGKELWTFANDNFLIVKILSSLGRDKDNKSAMGKLGWLKNNIPDLSTSDIILVESKYKKQEYSRPFDIIIDDTPVVIEQWEAKGGIGILHKNLNDTITRLKSYVYNENI